MAAQFPLSLLGWYHTFHQKAAGMNALIRPDQRAEGWEIISTKSTVGDKEGFTNPHYRCMWKVDKPTSVELGPSLKKVTHFRQVRSEWKLGPTSKRRERVK